MKLRLALDDQDGGEVFFDVPARFDVCPRCEGHGTHLTESIGEHAYSAEEFAESFDEEREEYFRRGGRYDIQCRECRGARVVAVPDETSPDWTPEARELFRAYEEHAAKVAQWDTEDARTRKMEDGGW